MRSLKPLYGRTKSAISSMCIRLVKGKKQYLRYRYEDLIDEVVMSYSKENYPSSEYEDTVVERLLGFINKGVNIADYRLLFISIEYGYEKILEVMLLAGCSANESHYSVSSCSSPLHWAVKFNREGIVKLLILHEADIDKLDPGCCTALERAIDMQDNEYIPVIKLLQSAQMYRILKMGRRYE